MNTFKKGIFTENPLFAQLLGVCPALATTTSLSNALGMGLAFTSVLIGSNIVISLLKSYIPAQVRIPSYIVIIASLVTITEMLMQGFLPDIYSALGIFIPLIVVNCIILGRAEAFASKNGLWQSLLDALGMGTGYTAALSIVASFRELLGAGTLLDYPLLGQSFQPVLIFVLPAGAFLTMGMLFAGINFYQQHREARHG